MGENLIKLNWRNSEPLFIISGIIGFFIALFWMLGTIFAVDPDYNSQKVLDVYPAFLKVQCVCKEP